MEEKLYTIPVTEAFEADDECPFCFMEKKIEQELLDFILGSASTYMESDVRSQTDADGFCKEHFQKMFHYGNTLGNAWIMKTHFETMRKELQKEINAFSPNKTGFLEKFQKKKMQTRNNISEWVEKRDKSCYICSRFKKTYQRYVDTFFYLYKKEDSMREKVKAQKGFCLHHFGQLCETAEKELNQKQSETFYQDVFGAMKQAFERVQEDIDWLVDKFDYRNQDADWKNSKDALQRAMQKLHGGYPAEPWYKQK